MGTPDFALASLQALIQAGHTVCAVVTQPDRPKGRGMKLTPPPVKEFALAHGLEVYQPETLRNGALEPVLVKYQPELIVVVAYGKILPQYVLDFPAKGCVNVHGSLLPKYRGAAPIQRAVINGETRTGVSIMYMDIGLDTGDVILKRELDIGPEDTAEDIFDRLAPLGAQALVEAVDLIESGKALRTPQDDALHTLAPPLSREDARIDWRADDDTVRNLIRGCYSWPIAYTACEGKRIKIYQAGRGKPVNAEAGTVVSVSEQGMEVACGNGRSVLITLFQVEGKKRMTPAEYFRGHESMLTKKLV